MGGENESVNPLEDINDVKLVIGKLNKYRINREIYNLILHF